MTALRLLIVKTSSMGDVVHALPAVTDILRRHPDAEVDWLVEAPFAAIPRLHPGVRKVLPMKWRQWRGQLWRSDTRAAIRAVAAELRGGHYDLVIDFQGLVKSALWARRAQAPVAGFGFGSVREPLAALAYRQRGRVSLELHAVPRCRLLAAAVLGYPAPTDAPDFGIRAPTGGWSQAGDYAVLIPNASRVSKHWPQRSWIAVGQRLLDRGMKPVVLWGRPDEQTLAEGIAAGCDGEVPPFLTVGEMAGVLAGASQIVGLDTGFSHLGAALGRPTVGIYCDHEPRHAGITGPGPVASIGGKGQVPSLAEVMALLEAQLALRGQGRGSSPLV